MSKTVIGIFNTIADAQLAADHLVTQGISESNIDVSSGNSTSTDLSQTADHSNENGISRFFKNLFGDDNDTSDRYTTVAKRGSIVTVHVSGADEADNVTALLDQYGAIDVDDNYSQHNEKSGNYDAPGNGNQTIQIIEENLQVGKKEIETGGVRLKSRVIEKPVEENLRLRQERVRIERKQVDRPALASDLANFQEGTIELKEHGEVPVVSKEARIVEEVSLGKDVEYRDEVISDTVKKTEVDIENLGSDLKTSGI